MLSLQWWWVKWRGGGASTGLELVAAAWVLPYQNWKNKLCGRKLLLTEPAFDLKIRKKKNNKWSPEEDGSTAHVVLYHTNVSLSSGRSHTHTHRMLTQDIDFCYSSSRAQNIFITHHHLSQSITHLNSVLPTYSRVSGTPTSQHFCQPISCCTGRTVPTWLWEGRALFRLGSSKPGVAPVVP